MSQSQNGTPGSGVMESLFQLMQHAGFPKPQDVVAELQRLNDLGTSMQPDLAKLAAASTHIGELSQAISRLDPQAIPGLTQALNTLSGKLDPQDLRNLTDAVVEGTQEAKRLQQRFWPESGK